MQSANINVSSKVANGTLIKEIHLLEASFIETKNKNQKKSTTIQKLIFMGES